MNCATAPGMMTLISLAIGVAYGYSLAVTVGLDGEPFYWDGDAARCHAARPLDRDAIDRDCIAPSTTSPRWSRRWRTG